MTDEGSSWVDLVDVQAGDRVLLVDGGSRRAEAALRGRASQVTVVDERSLATLPTVIRQEGPWDLLCLDAADAKGVPTEVWAALAPHARVVAVGDNLLSPVRVADMVLRGRSGPGARLGPGATVARLREVGLVEQQMFGLLRSSDEPVVAFDALATSSLPAVWGATLAHVHGRRRTAMNAAARLSARQLLRLCPGWLVIAGASGGVAADRVVGKVSNRDSDEIKLLRGDPITAVERHYLRSDPSAEIAALRELEEVGFTLAPRISEGTTPTSSRFSWMPGRPLPVASLGEAQLAEWVGRAAEVLAGLQRLTRRPDGTVLVHGDLWLGNLLVEGDRVVAVIDWAQAHRGAPETDRDFLVDSLERWITSPELRRSLERARDQGLARA